MSQSSPFPTSKLLHLWPTKLQLCKILCFQIVKWKFCTQVWWAVDFSIHILYLIFDKCWTTLRDFITEVKTTTIKIQKVNMQFVKLKQLCCVPADMLSSCETWLETECQHFKTFVSWGKFYGNMLRFPWLLLMHFAGSFPSALWCSVTWLNRVPASYKLDRSLLLL
jgi:hypothetical protein